MAQTSMTSFFASNAGEGGKKRSRNDENDNAANINNNKRKKHASNNIVLLTLPGAGGKSSKQAIKLYEELQGRRGGGMRVCRMDETEPVKWNKYSPSHKSNMKAVVAAAKRASNAYPHAKRIVLCGHSFGCRVAAEAMRSAQRTELLQGEANIMDALVCLGYPLVKSGVAETDSNNVKRAAHLQQLPSSVKTLIVQGERDNFLGPRGMASLRDLLDGMSDDHDITLVEVPKCGHDLTAKAVPQVREAILDFVAGLEEDDE